MSTAPCRVVVVTGTRAEFGLLRSTLHAIQRESALDLHLVVTGMHLVGITPTVLEIEAEFPIAARVPMQQDGQTGRAADVEATARGIGGFGRRFEDCAPDVVLVLGDRIEAFAAATAASIGGIRVAHIHGGDRAEGVADEAMRHAITKLAHIHFAASEQSAQRIRSLGEDPQYVVLVGSPAIDGLDRIEPATDEALAMLGLDPARPFAVVLHHPSGLAPEIEQDTMTAIVAALETSARLGSSVILAPNHDPGREAVLAGIGERGVVSHLPRPRFIAVLKRAACLVGNSSAGLIEAAALNLPVVNVGPRQAGRERAANAIDVASPSAATIGDAIEIALDQARSEHAPMHPFGDGHAGARIATTLAEMATTSSLPSIRKRCVY